MHDVGNIARSYAPSPEPKIAIIPSREFVTVDTEEDAPDEIAGVPGKESEYRIECDSLCAGSVDLDGQVVHMASRLPGPQPNVPIAKPTPYGPRISVVIR